MEAGTFVELLNSRVAKTPGQPALAYPAGGRWTVMTWADVGHLTDQLAHGLMSLGVSAGERIGILSRSRLEWILSDLAIQKVAGCTVPVHADSLADMVRHVLSDSGSTVVLVENEKQHSKLSQILDQTAIKRVVLMGGPARGPGEIRWDELLAAGRVHQIEFPDSLQDRTREVTGKSLASIVYTAGTTGLPKGVMLTHDSFLFEAQALAEVMKGVVSEEDVHLLCLPLSHVLARIMVLASVGVGYCTVISAGLDALEQELPEVRPTFVTVVPGILENLHATLLKELDDGGWLYHRLFRWAYQVGGAVAGQRAARKPLPVGLALRHLLSEKLVVRPVTKERFGGRIKFVVCGGAPLSVDIAEFFHALGLLVLEGYGLTENLGAANVNRPNHYRIGTVGPPIPGVEEKIAPDGEILIRGRNVMAGYYRQPEATREVLDQEGWLHTGDVGRIEPDGFLTVTDRKKDIIVSSGGKNISPQNIEKLLRTCQYIDQAMVYGDGRKYLTALVSLDQERVQRFAEEEGIPFDRFSDLGAHPRIHQLIAAEIAERNRQLESHEAVVRFTILPDPLSMHAGEITPTMKVRRKEVGKRYRDLIEAMYQDSSEKVDQVCLGER